MAHAIRYAGTDRCWLVSLYARVSSILRLGARGEASTAHGAPAGKSHRMLHICSQMFSWQLAHGIHKACGEHNAPNLLLSLGVILSMVSRPLCFCRGLRRRWTQRNVSHRYMRVRTTLQFVKCLSLGGNKPTQTQGKLQHLTIESRLEVSHRSPWAP